MKSKQLLWGVASLLCGAALAVEPDTQVIEFYHPVLKHYFITASATDARLVDSGAAGKDWVRTGITFPAWSKRELAPSDGAMVYRFYSPGANSHFYTAHQSEVELLKSMEADERARIAGTGQSFFGWGFEGEAFVVQLPKNGACSDDSQAITRVYNHGFATGEGSNHRYVSDDSMKRSMEDRKWTAEGTAFCAPKSSSTNGGGSSSSASVAEGKYSGTATFKFEEVGKPEVKTRATLTLELAKDGALTASGAGCSFKGTATAKSTSDSRLRGGSVVATGCSDARFNGTYGRVEIEQFGTKAIDVRFKQGDDAKEAKVEGTLTLESGTPTPTPNPTPTPPPSNASAVAGEFSGSATWLITERRNGQTEQIVFNANQTLSLKITDAGVVTGSGQGCTFAGTVSPGENNRFIGTVTATGCTQSRLNGNYEAKVHPEDGGAIEAEFEREAEQGGVRTKVSIEGELAKSTGTPPATTPPPTTPPPTTPPPTTPPASGIAIAGSYAGNADWSATRRPNGGREVSVVATTQALRFTVAANGDVTGSGQGCTFSGKLAAVSVAGVFSGNVTASGCTESIINGTFATTATRQDASGLEVELERESETGGERIKVKIKGRLAKQ